MSNNHPEFQKYLKDKQDYPLNEYSFEFGEIKCTMTRSIDGNWIGYLIFPKQDNNGYFNDLLKIYHPDSDKTKSELQDIYQFYGGLTNDLSFKTDHSFDYKPIRGFNEPNATYKDYSFMYKEFQRLEKLANDRLYEYLGNLGDLLCREIKYKYDEVRHLEYVMDDYDKKVENYKKNNK